DTAGGFNAGLNAQKAVNLELGIRSAGRFGYSVSVYQASVRGELISYAVVGSPGRVFFRNSGKSRHRGIEAGLNAAPTGWLSVSAAWTHSDFVYTEYVLPSGT